MDIKSAIEQRIKQARQAGKPDSTIYVELLDDKTVVGAKARQFGAQAQKLGVHPRALFEAYFGLDIKPVDMRGVHDRDISKTQSHLESAASKLAELGGGILQGVGYAGDKINEKINDTFGTNLSTQGREAVTRDLKKIKPEVDKGRRGSGRGEGTDVTAALTGAAATLPFYLAGGVAGAGTKGLATFAGRQGAIGAGLGAAQYADDAGKRKQNMVLNAAGSAVGGVVGEKVIAPAIKTVGSKVIRKVADVRGSSAQQAAHIKQSATRAVDDALESTGLTLDDALKDNITRDVAQALAKGKQLDAAALARKKLLEKYNIQGTQAQITRDPSKWAAEREAAKHSDALNETHIANHKQLDELMQKLVDDTGTQQLDDYGRMQSTFNTLKQADEAAQQNINKLYDDAVSDIGADTPLQKDALANSIKDMLTREGESSYTKSVLNMLDGALDKNGALTLKAAEGLKKRINRKIGTTTDGNERWVLGQVKQLIDEQADASVKNVSSGLGAAKQKYNTARGAAKQRFETLENTPLLKAVVDGAEPDKAFDKYVIKGNVSDLVRTVDVLKKAPNGQQSIKDLQGMAVEHFLKQATKSNNGSFSPSGLNRALNSFGDNRMKALFTPQQIARLNDIKQVADILVQQPLGAHVNHSNTANVLIKQLMGIVNTAGKMPVVGNVALGAVDAVGGLTKAGAAAKMMHGTVPVLQKGGLLGLSPRQMAMLGLSADIGRAGSAAVGAGAVSD